MVFITVSDWDSTRFNIPLETFYSSVKPSQTISCTSIADIQTDNNEKENIEHKDTKKQS